MSNEKKQALLHLKTVRGQIDGIIKMLEEDRYCIDISTQISASTALLKKANLIILQGHLNHCIISAIENHELTEAKINEIKKLIASIIK